MPQIGPRPPSSKELRVGVVLVALCAAWGCGGGAAPPGPATPSPTPTPARVIDLSRYYYPINIDYGNPSLYVQGGTQSTLTSANVSMVNGQIQVPTKNLEGVGRIFKWIAANFAGAAGGGATIGRTDVNADPAGYGVTSNAILTARMAQFAQAFPTITPFFPTYDIRPLPDT